MTVDIYGHWIPGIFDFKSAPGGVEPPDLRIRSEIKQGIAGDVHSVTIQYWRGFQPDTSQAQHVPVHACIGREWSQNWAHPYRVSALDGGPSPAFAHARTTCKKSSVTFACYGAFQMTLPSLPKRVSEEGCCAVTASVFVFFSAVEPITARRLKTPSLPESNKHQLAWTKRGAQSVVRTESACHFIVNQRSK